MTLARRMLIGVAVLPCLGTTARAECFSGCGYGTLIAIIVLGGLALVGLILFVMVKLGAGWLIKWVVGAAVLAVAVPPIVIAILHSHRQRVFEARDLAGPLPRLADRTPLVIIGGDLFQCPPPVERYIRAWAGKGVIVLTTWPIEGIDFTKPVALADLPLSLHVGGRTGTDPDAENPYKGYSYHVRSLTPEQRQAAAASIDYVVVAECSQRHDIFRAFAANPALQEPADRFEVELAMAPVAKGSGTLSIPDLRFDLLDLGYLGYTEGFLFAEGQVGGRNSVPYDLATLEAALCLRANGTLVAGCAQ
ncbi:MAG: hypothetical protein HC783_14610 [Rhodobacteraceae bacterium]|nr:hypothetical protein [Paracoccaceae bacterium]